MLLCHTLNLVLVKHMGLKGQSRETKFGTRGSVRTSLASFCTESIPARCSRGIVEYGDRSIQAGASASVHASQGKVCGREYSMIISAFQRACSASNSKCG